MFKTLFVLLLVITSFLPLKGIEAVEVTDLYEASVAIKSRNNADRATALKEALAAVMVKVGGDKSVLDNKIIKKSLQNYHAYLNQYRYQLKMLPVIEQTIDSSKVPEQLFLLASFNEDKINQLFQQASLALWGSLRPQLLLWLVDEDGLTRTIMSNSTVSPLPSIVNYFSIQRGLPIIMPLMDLTDASQITSSDIWGRFEQPVRKASKRYSAEAIVIMRISNSSLRAIEASKNKRKKSKDCGVACTQAELNKQSYILDWSLLSWSPNGDQTSIRQEYQGKEREALLNQGLSDITELIYQHYAVSTINSNDFIIEVDNIGSMTTYVDVFDFLSNLSAVKSVTLLQAEGTSRRFKLQLLGSVNAFIASLSLNKQLKHSIYPLARYNETLIDHETGKKAVPIFNWVN